MLALSVIMIIIDASRPAVWLQKEALDFVAVSEGVQLLLLFFWVSSYSCMYIHDVTTSCGQAPVCCSDQFQLTLNTTKVYLKWMIMNYTRKISSVDISQQNSQINVNSTSFDFVRTSGQGLPLITTLTIIKLIIPIQCHYNKHNIIVCLGPY